MSEFKERMLRNNMKIALTVILIFVSTLSQGNNPEHWSYVKNKVSFQTADSLYSLGEYNLALSSFNQISDVKYGSHGYKSISYIYWAYAL